MTIEEQLENAVINGQLEWVKEILRIHKNEVTAERLDNMFEYASECGHLEVVKYLLTLDNPKVYYSANSDEAFRKAAGNGHLEVVKHLLTLDNPKVDYRAQYDGAFQAAVSNGHLEVVKHLLTLDNPKVDYSAYNDEAFRYAAQSGHLEVVKHLLTLDNPKVDYRAEYDEAFRFAAQNGRLNVINHLLTLPNTDPSANDFQAVIWALEEQHQPVVETIARWVRAHGTDTQRNRLDEILGNRGVVINYEQSIHAAEKEVLPLVVQGFEESSKEHADELQPEEPENANTTRQDVSTPEMHAELRAMPRGLLVRKPINVSEIVVDSEHSKSNDVAKAQVIIGWKGRAVTGAAFAFAGYVGTQILASKLAYAFLLHASAPLVGAVVALALGALTARFVKSGLVSIANGVKSLFGYGEIALEAAAENNPSSSVTTTVVEPSKTFVPASQNAASTLSTTVKSVETIAVEAARKLAK